MSIFCQLFISPQTVFNWSCKQILSYPQIINLRNFSWFQSLSSCYLRNVHPLQKCVATNQAFQYKSLTLTVKFKIEPSSSASIVNPFIFYLWTWCFWAFLRVLPLVQETTLKSLNQYRPEWTQNLWKTSSICHPIMFCKLLLCSYNRFMFRLTEL